LRKESIHQIQQVQLVLLDQVLQLTLLDQVLQLVLLGRVLQFVLEGLVAQEYQGTNVELNNWVDNNYKGALIVGCAFY
jgi:hypothetical protein